MNRTRVISVSMFVATAAAVLLLQGCAANDAFRNKADRFTLEKDFDAAVKYYNKALSEDPDNLDLKFRLKDSRQKASIQHMRKAEKLMKEKYFKQAIEELQVSIAFYSGNRRAVALIDKAKRMKESGYYLDKGKQQIKNGDYRNARKSFQKAQELNENNLEAQTALEKFKKPDHELSEYRLDLQSDAPISMKFKKTPILNVFEILSKLTGVNFIFDRDIQDSKVSLFMTDVSFDRFLDVLLDTHFLKAKLINRKTMLIYPDTPGKAKEYDELYVKTFYLSYLSAKSAVAILSGMLNSKNITSNDKLNTLTVRGRKKEVDMAGRILEANDRTPSEVVLNVEILEVQRSKEKDF